MNTSPATETPPLGQPPARWILVVDDESAMRNLIEIVLQGQGWSVRTAGGAEDAMDTIRAAAQPPAVVVCDVLMPGVDGLELTRRMCARVPSLSVIFISGHLTDVSWWPSDLREHRFLAKPFENVQLVDAVRDAFNDSTPPAR
jgi:FixJ family two-component response regulator